MSAEEDVTLATVDAFEVQDVADALSDMELSERTSTLLRAFASAPNRCLTRLQLAQSVGADHENACNSILGSFASRLIESLNDDVAEEWRRDKYYVNFVQCSVQRPDLKRRPDPDLFAFVMREALAQALARIGHAPYVALSPELTEIIYPEEEFWEDPLKRVGDPLGDIEEAAEEFVGLSVTERTVLIKARIGQGQFRDDVLAAWDGCCAVTGASVGAALVASHIKPWRVCTNEERLDPCNGLPLIGTLDRLFDAGLITFLPDGLMVISSILPDDELEPLGLSHGLRLRVRRPQSERYLAYHREHRFELESRSKPSQ